MTDCDNPYDVIHISFSDCHYFHMQFGVTALGTVTTSLILL